MANPPILHYGLPHNFNFGGTQKFFAADFFGVLHNHFSLSQKYIFTTEIFLICCIIIIVCQRNIILPHKYFGVSHIHIFLPIGHAGNDWKHSPPNKNKSI